ncbi:MAG: hypothetical protein HY360_05445 [Verrucomicrobia bacterium]|nr:hypothetical protein [Verrucomicrobiota bacterium]
MRPLTDKEKRLTLFLLVASFALANLFGLSLLSQKRKELESQLFCLRIEQLDARNWRMEKDLWMERKKWLDSKQPKIHAPGEANANLLEMLQTSARRQKIIIVGQSFTEPVTQPFYHEISVKLTVNGTLEALTHWLVELQQPEHFQAVRRFALKSDAEPPKIKCDLQVSRLYLPPTSP